jgi:enamine deaminase RidA (YjgF/YER057c/UK114 family)
LKRRPAGIRESQAVLEDSGSSLEHVIKVTCFLTDPECLPALNTRSPRSSRSHRRGISADRTTAARTPVPIDAIAVTI